MQLKASYTDTYKEALEKQRFAVGHLYQLKAPMNIDTIGCYKIFYIVSGQKKFHIDDEVYDVKPGDLFLLNQREYHYFSQVNMEESQERIVCFIYPDYLKALSSDATDLTACFHNDSGFRHKLSLKEKEQTQLLHYIQKLSQSEEYGQDVFDLSVFLEMMVYVNRIVHSRQHAGQEGTMMHNSQSRQLKEIMAYINLHITEDISIEQISDAFFISPSYLCRMFKNGTGTTIHRYITANRITLAKDLLSAGHSCQEACNASGFKDYNGFWKSFVKLVGVSPAKYGQF